MPFEGSSPLGKPTQYPEQYTPELLFAIARQHNRQQIGIGEPLPFVGVDIWNAYELSWLNQRGKPQVALAQFIFPADSPQLIESKSFKLYLNSFNQTRVASNEKLLEILSNDLSTACGAQVHVKLIEPSLFAQQSVIELPGYCIDHLDVEIEHYAPNKALLQLAGTEQEVEETLTSHLLKSNCPVTQQPDWGSVSIYYAGPPINHASLLKYLISFRQHQGFHEQCVERIFTDITQQCKPQRLAVYARYTRRGGLDINPFRSNFSGALPPNIRTARQ